MKPFQTVGGVHDCSKLITENINRLFVNREPWQVATITASAVLSSIWLWSFINQDESKYGSQMHKYIVHKRVM